MAECTLPSDTNRTFTGGKREPYYTDEQNYALILEQHARGLRVLSETAQRELEKLVQQKTREWARGLA